MDESRFETGMRIRREVLRDEHVDRAQAWQTDFDLCIMRPHPTTTELTVIATHSGVTHKQLSANTGRVASFANLVEQTSPPSEDELALLRDLQARTARAHSTATA